MISQSYKCSCDEYNDKSFRLTSNLVDGFWQQILKLVQNKIKNPGPSKCLLQHLVTDIGEDVENTNNKLYLRLHKLVVHIEVVTPMLKTKISSDYSESKFVQILKKLEGNKKHRSD